MSSDIVIVQHVRSRCCARDATIQVGRDLLPRPATTSCMKRMSYKENTLAPRTAGFADNACKRAATHKRGEMAITRRQRQGKRHSSSSGKKHCRPGALFHSGAAVRGASGLTRTPGKREYSKRVSWVRIPPLRQFTGRNRIRGTDWSAVRRVVVGRRCLGELSKEVGHFLVMKRSMSSRRMSESAGGDPTTGDR